MWVLYKEPSNIKIPCFSILRLKIFSCQKCKQICGAAGRWFLQNRTSSSAISQWRVVTVQKFDDVLCDIVQLSHTVPGITLQWSGFSQQKAGDFHPPHSYLIPCTVLDNIANIYVLEIFECTFLLSTTAVAIKNI